MRKYLRSYWEWIVRFFINFFAIGVIVLFPYAAKAHDNSSCTEATPKLQMNANFGSVIEVPDSAPIGTILKTVPISNIEIRMKCDSQPHNPPPGFGPDYGQELLETTYSLKLGTGAAVPGLPGVCATGVPGVGLKLANFSNFSPSRLAYPFRMLNEQCSMNDENRGSDGSFYIHGYDIQIQNGSFDIQLIKTGPPPKNPTSFSVPPLQFSLANRARWGARWTSGHLRDPHWFGPVTGISIITGPNTVVAKSPSCTFAGTNSQTVSFDRVETKTLQDNTAPYKTFTLPFNCEAGAKLELAQLHIDGAGVSANWTSPHLVDTYALPFRSPSWHKEVPLIRKHFANK